MNIFAQCRAAAAIVLTLSLLATQALAAPAGERGRLMGELNSFGQVQVDGADAASGATVLPGSRFTTAKESGAVINLGELGRVSLSAETAAQLAFGEQGLRGGLEGGVITVAKPEGVAAVFSAGDSQVVADQGSAVVFTLSSAEGVTRVKTQAGKVEFRAGGASRTVGAGETAQSGQGQGGQGGGGNSGGGRGLGRNAAYGIIGFTGLVLAAVIYALTHDEDPGTGPPVIVISPSR